MKNKSILIYLLLFQCLGLWAQEPMVAYRKEGIWHYFDTNGKQMWEPFMDVASFPSGWCNGLLQAASLEIKTDKTANIDFQRKQVLYDKKGKIVFQPQFESAYRIVTGFDKVGYIQLRDMESDGLVICDKTGNVKYKAFTSNSHYLGDGVVEYIEDSNDMDGDEPHILFDIKTMKPLAKVNCAGFLGNFEQGAVFSYTASGHYGIYDRSGKMLQPSIWDSNLMNDDEETLFATGFVSFQDTMSKKWHIFNKKGEAVLGNIDEVVQMTNAFLLCEMTVNGETQEQQFFLNNGKASKVDAKYGKIVGNTEGGILACLKENGDVILIDKTLKTIATIKNVTDIENIKILKTHIWIGTEKENTYDCYNEKGQKVGTIQAIAIGNAAYNHVPFMQNDKWGLAHESGKIIINPTFEFDESDIPEVRNGYFEVKERLKERSFRFDFYNFQGKLALSTTAEKDGWDYILPQESVSYSYRFY